MGFLFRKHEGFSGFSLCVPDACLHLRGSEGRSKGRYEKGRTQWRSRRLLKKRWKQPCSRNGHGHGRGRIWQEGLRWPLLSQETTRKRPSAREKTEKALYRSLPPQET